MPDFKYEHLTDEQQLAAIRTRLRTLEETHLNVSLDVQSAGAAGNPAQAARLKEIEDTITDLRKREAALTK